MNVSERVDAELLILERIHKGDEVVHQRDIARALGISLGMTNAILKRLANKGWLQIKKINNRNVQYIVLPHGIEQLATRSYRYFKRTIRNVVYYKEILQDLIHAARDQGYGRIVLVGDSDVDFIVEHVCMKSGMLFFRKSVDSASPFEAGADKCFYVVSEKVEPMPASGRQGRAYLREMLT